MYAFVERIHWYGGPNLIYSVQRTHFEVELSTPVTAPQCSIVLINSADTNRRQYNRIHHNNRPSL